MGWSSYHLPRLAQGIPEGAASEGQWWQASYHVCSRIRGPPEVVIALLEAYPLGMYQRSIVSFIVFLILSFKSSSHAIIIGASIANYVERENVLEGNIKHQFLPKEPKKIEFELEEESNST